MADLEGLPLLDDMGESENIGIKGRETLGHYPGEGLEHEYFAERPSCPHNEVNRINKELTYGNMKQKRHNEGHRSYMRRPNDDVVSSFSISSSTSSTLSLKLIGKQKYQAF